MAVGNRWKSSFRRLYYAWSLSVKMKSSFYSPSSRHELKSALQSPFLDLDWGLEMMQAAAAVNNSLNKKGFNVGLKTGHVYVARRMSFESNPKFIEDTNTLFDTELDLYDNLTFPGVAKLEELVVEPTSRVKEAVQGLYVPPPSSQ